VRTSNPTEIGFIISMLCPVAMKHILRNLYETFNFLLLRVVTANSEAVVLSVYTKLVRLAAVSIAAT
jgi:hypothetical protein